MCRKTMKKNTTTVNGYMQAMAEQVHPLQTRMKLVLTPFTPNVNKQGIPREEADNFIRTALYQPLKMRVGSKKPQGHDYATPLGLITSAAVEIIDNEEVIVGEAILWKDEFANEDKMLRELERVDTSWEVYYTELEETNDIQWLRGVTFAGTCIVDNPAYAGKTPVLAIAEKQKQMELEEKVKELEAKLAEMLPLAEKVTQLEQDLSAKETELSTVNAKLGEYQEAERQAAAEKLRNDRVAALKNAGMSEEKISARVDYYVALDNDVFDALVSDLSEVATKKSVAEDKSNDKVEDKKPALIPEPQGSNNLSPKALAAALKQLNKK